MSDSVLCPRCAMDLVSRAGEGGAECPSCGGVFYDADTLRALLAEVRDAPDAAPYSRPPLSLNDPVQYLRCPLCPEMMNRHNFGESSGVIVDICNKDGVWFDDGELAQVIAFCASGELTKSEKLAHLR
ncbi:MAG TPA: zf-TFIIB domain-containing protein, partial [Polyangiaceae bacterium]|nr:zf-TFIIB domain-containing protein [Polyangiaceae bacterium]